MTGRADDPAKQVARKYTDEDVKIFYGNTEAVIMVKDPTKPTITEKDVTYETDEDLKKLTDKNLIDYGFNADDFLKEK